MATTQKVIGVLRKAGLDISQYHASGMVRGWGSFTRGYQVRKYGEVIRVEYQPGDHQAVRDRNAAANAQALEALKAAGLNAKETGTDFARWLEVVR